jgi:hypothetical protein
MPELDEIPGGIAKLTRDAAYVAVGLGVLGLQRTQVQRQAIQRRVRAGELEEAVEDVVAGLRAGLTRGVQQADAVVEATIVQLESSLEPLEQQLPPPVRELVALAHARVREARCQLRQAVTSAG